VRDDAVGQAVELHAEDRLVVQRRFAARGERASNHQRSGQRSSIAALSGRSRPAAYAAQNSSSRSAARAVISSVV
jgi:hypothetical protein